MNFLELIFNSVHKSLRILVEDYPILKTTRKVNRYVLLSLYNLAHFKYMIICYRYKFTFVLDSFFHFYILINK